MIVPAKEYCRSQLFLPENLPTGMDRLVHGLMGRFQNGFCAGKMLERKAIKICEQARGFETLGNKKIQAKLIGLSHGFRRRSKDSETRVDEAFALLVVASGRVLGMTPYPEQVMGALAMHTGYISEMATGEGKTLVAGLVAVVAGWTRRPCHVLTVNDYLAERDAQILEPFYSFCGVSVGSVLRGMESFERRSNYECSVVYTTSQELLADFLRDRLQMGAYGSPSRRMLKSLTFSHAGVDDKLVLRGLDTVIVDEADSILIDDAITPLIISSKSENRVLTDAVTIAANIAQQLERGKDYQVDLTYRSICLTNLGLEKLVKASVGLPLIWRGPARRVELIKQALAAREFYILGKEYVIQEGAVVIVAERTGRLMPDRSWSNGLHQAVEAKEGLEISRPTETLASLSFQKFFRFFRKLSGMTGTGREVAGELWHIYKVPIMVIPTHRPCKRKIYTESVYPDLSSKFAAVVDEIEHWNAVGRPVLVGTRTVKDSERLSALVVAKGMDFDLLNAVHHKDEAAIIARAGQVGRITIATNMAGRGTDIKLAPEVDALGGLHVVSLERNESGRIDRQLFGRCARQGNPGSVHGCISVEDEQLVRFFLPGIITILKALKRSQIPGCDQLIRVFFYFARQRTLRMAYRQRANVLSLDTWMDEALSFIGSKP